VFHVIPISTSWLHAAEDLVPTPTRRCLQRGMPQAAADPEQPIARCIREHNATPKHSDGPGPPISFVPGPTGCHNLPNESVQEAAGRGLPI
jgi:hypothetical protein